MRRAQPSRPKLRAPSTARATIVLCGARPSAPAIIGGPLRAASIAAATSIRARPWYDFDGQQFDRIAPGLNRAIEQRERLVRVAPGDRIGQFEQVGNPGRAGLAEIGGIERLAVARRNSGPAECVRGGRETPPWRAVNKSLAALASFKPRLRAKSST